RTWTRSSSVQHASAAMLSPSSRVTRHPLLAGTAMVRRQAVTRSRIAEKATAVPGSGRPGVRAVALPDGLRARKPSPVVRGCARGWQRRLPELVQLDRVQRADAPALRLRHVAEHLVDHATGLRPVAPVVWVVRRPHEVLDPDHVAVEDGVAVDHERRAPVAAV